MNKYVNKFVYFFVTFLCIFIFSNGVEAASVNNYELVDANIYNNVMPAVDDQCNSLFGDVENDQDPAYWMQWVLTAMKYVAIAALLLYVTMDFIKALVANDKDALKKASATAIKRFIYCVIIFFLPIIVELLMSLVGAYGTCDIG